MSQPVVTPRDEMNLLLEPLFEFAKQELVKHGEFYPFAAVVNDRGIVGMAGILSVGDRPSVQDVLDGLYRSLQEQARRSEIRACGVCTDVRIQGRPQDDAIRAALEHVAGDPVHVFLPHERKRLRGVAYGELFGTVGERRVFV